MATYTRDRFREQLHPACSSGNVQLVKELCDAKVKDASSGADAVALCGHDFSAKDGLMGQTPLHAAAENGFHDIVVLLVEQDADVNAQDNDGWTPLHWACSMKLEDGAGPTVEALLKGEASVGIQTTEGDTALHFAAANGHLEAVKLLIKAGANVNRHNDEEITPAHVAASRGHTEIIKELRSAGADMTRRNSRGNNPLHFASRANQLDTLQELTNSDPDALNEANSLGQTPADIAGSPFIKEAAKPFRNAIVVVKAALRFGKGLRRRGSKSGSGITDTPREETDLDSSNNQAGKRCDSPPTPLNFRLSKTVAADELF